MKLHYYPETDSLCVELKAGPGPEVRSGTTVMAWGCRRVRSFEAGPRDDETLRAHHCPTQEDRA